VVGSSEEWKVKERGDRATSLRFCQNEPSKTYELQFQDGEYSESLVNVMMPCVVSRRQLVLGLDFNG